MTTTTLVNNAGKTVSHEGHSGFTVTAQREGNNLNVLMEFDRATMEEGVAMVGAFMAQLEELYGEGFVTACLGHYALDTGKGFMDAGDHKLVILRGERRAKKRGK